MKIEKVARAEPEFDFIDYFMGYTKASGWFSDRFGNVRRHFCGDFNGSLDGDVFVLDETLHYADGMVDTRQWRVSISEDGAFRAESDSLDGGAAGQLVGNTLQLNYKMNVEIEEGKIWLLGMNDWMFYQSDGSLHNITNVSKWGVKIGTVSTQYTKFDDAASDSGTPRVAACN